MEAPYTGTSVEPAAKVYCGATCVATVAAVAVTGAAEYTTDGLAEGITTDGLAEDITTDGLAEGITTDGLAEGTTIDGLAAGITTEVTAGITAGEDITTCEVAANMDSAASGAVVGIVSAATTDMAATPGGD